MWDHSCLTHIKKVFINRILLTKSVVSNMLFKTLVWRPILGFFVLFSVGGFLEGDWGQKEREREKQAAHPVQNPM